MVTFSRPLLVTLILNLTLPPVSGTEVGSAVLVTSMTGGGDVGGTFTITVAESESFSVVGSIIESSPVAVAMLVTLPALFRVTVASPVAVPPADRSSSNPSSSSSDSPVLIVTVKSSPVLIVPLSSTTSTLYRGAQLPGLVIT